MNNHVKYQFVLGSFGHLRPVTCQASSSPSLSQPHAARTLCEYIRIHQHTQYEYYQHSRGSCFKCLTLSSFLLPLLLLFNVGFHFHCLRASFFSVPPPLPVHCEVFSQSPHSNNNNSNNYATWLAHTRNSCCARSSSFLVLSTSKWSCKLQRSSLSCLPLPSSCPANPVTVSLSPTFPFPFADPETQTSVGLAAINRLSRQLKTL